MCRNIGKMPWHRHVCVRQPVMERGGEEILEGKQTPARFRDCVAMEEM